MAFLKPKFKFGASASTTSALDEAEHHRGHELTRLHTSTRAGKHFQKDVVKGIGDFVSLGHRQSETSTRLAEDCKRYGSDGPSVREKLSKATVQYGVAKNKMEKERENLHRALTTLVAEPLKAMANGSPLKDARTLKQKYDRLRQEVEAQGNEVTKRKAKENPEVAKVQAAEHKLEEITGAMEAMGKNALAAMSLVESQQQHVNLQKILAMVEYERAYFQRVTGILDQLHCEIEAQVHSTSTQLALPPPIASPQPTPLTASRQSSAQQHPSHASHAPTPSPQHQKAPHLLAADDDLHEHQNAPSYDLDDQELELEHWSERHDYGDEARGPGPGPDGGSRGFYAVATNDFEGEDVSELTIAIGDEVLVRQVSESGWSEGLCNGQSGWFPSTYVKKQASVSAGAGGSHRQSALAVDRIR